MEAIVKGKTETLRNQLKDIIVEISWAKVAHRYFGKSAGWLYHKLDGVNSHGKKVDFTLEEKKQLKAGLLDLAGRIALAAENIK